MALWCFEATKEMITTLFYLLSVFHPIYLNQYALSAVVCTVHVSRQLQNSGLGLDCSIS
jgi:hypothetical protein